MDRRDQRRKRGDIVVARLFAGRPGVGDVDERPEINNGFLVLIPGVHQLFFFFRLGLYLLLHHDPVDRLQRQHVFFQ